jgi:hypothetical protein
MWYKRICYVVIEKKEKNESLNKCMCGHSFYPSSNGQGENNVDDR